MDKVTNVSTNSNTKAQQKALKKLGEQSIKLFVGDYDNFKNTELGSLIKSDEELEAMFNYIDKNGDGKISKKEIKEIAKLGKKGNDKKIDSSDIKTLLKKIKGSSEDSEKPVTRSPRTKGREDGEPETPEIETEDKKSPTVETEKDEQGRIKTEKLEDGTTIEYEYDENGKKTKETRKYKDGTKKIWDNYSYDEDGSYTCGLTVYDKNGNIKTQSEQDYCENGNLWAEAGTNVKEGFTYKIYYNENENGKKTIEKHKYKDGTEKVWNNYSYNEDGSYTCDYAFYNDLGYLQTSRQREYSKNGNLLKDTCRRNGTTWTYEFDENGNETKCIIQYKDGTKGVWDNYSYDKDGNYTCDYRYYDQNGSVEERCKLVYDKKNRNVITKEKYIDENGNVTKIVEYDERERKTAETTYKRDKKGNVIQTTKTKIDKNGLTIETVTDKNNKLTKKTITAKNGNKVVIEYDETGTKEISRKLYDKDGNEIKNTPKTKQGSKLLQEKTMEQKEEQAKKIGLKTPDDLIEEFKRKGKIK